MWKVCNTQRESEHFQDNPKGRSENWKPARGRSTHNGHRKLCNKWPLIQLAQTSGYTNPIKKLVEIIRRLELKNPIIQQLEHEYNWNNKFNWKFLIYV